MKQLLLMAKDWLHQLFSENGTVSSTRVNMILSLVMGFIIAMTGLFLNKDLASTAILVGAFVGPSAALKGYSKVVENGK
jgi:hypothetical protein